MLTEKHVEAVFFDDFETRGRIAISPAVRKIDASRVEETASESEEDVEEEWKGREEEDEDEEE